MYFFDSSAVIDWLYSNRLGKIIDRPIAISVLTICELLPYAKSKGKKTEKSLKEFFSEVSIFPINEAIAMVVSDIKHQLIKNGQEKSLIDIIIAVSASHHNFTLVTLDSDFQQISKLTNGSILHIGQTSK